MVSKSKIVAEPQQQQNLSNHDRLAQKPGKGLRQASPAALAAVALPPPSGASLAAHGTLLQDRIGSGQHVRDTVLQLQRHYGNRYVQRALAQLHVPLQAKLAVGSVDDPAEREADRIADLFSRAMGMSPPPQLHTATNVVNRNAHNADYGAEGGELTTDLDAAITGARSRGHPLKPTVRGTMEHFFGQDLGQVRVHADGVADRISRAINAVAFTSGRDIFFRRGAYRPDHSAGKHLLAHELTHVVQQSGKHVQRRCETETAATANFDQQVPSGDAVTARAKAPAVTIQRAIEKEGWVKPTKFNSSKEKNIKYYAKSYGNKKYNLFASSSLEQKVSGPWPEDTVRWENIKEQEQQQMLKETSANPPIEDKQEKELRQKEFNYKTLPHNEYKEEELPKESKLTEKQQKALALIESYHANHPSLKNSFKASTPTAQAYLMHLKTRIKEPEEINQNKTGLCGVVAFMYSIARNDPEAYVQYALELFEKGEASLGNFKVKATDKVACEALDLKDKFNMSLVDYVTGASLRISENKKPFQHNPANLETGFFTPLTTPKELPKWFELAGYETKYTARKINKSADIYDFNAAVAHFKRGDSVCLAVGWNLHERGGGDPYNALLGWVVGPDHWVVLTDVQKNRDSTIINLYSHGKIVSITLKEQLSEAEEKAQRHNNTKDIISWEQFLRHYYGYVAAWKSTG